MQNAIAGLGNCDIGVFSYVGNGKYGQDNPTTITFPKMPTGFFMWGGENYLAVEGNSTHAIMIYYTGSTTYVSQMLVSWKGNQFQFYHYDNPKYQMNVNGTYYWGLAFYQKS